jgi:hypothetical protein
MAVLQGLAGRPSQETSRIHARTLFTVTGARFVVDLAPSGLMRILPQEQLPAHVSMEAATFPYLFPYNSGWHSKPPSGLAWRYDFQKSLQHRCLQTYSVFTIHSAYLLMLKSMLNCSQVLTSCKGQGHVFKRAHDRVLRETPGTCRPVAQDKLVQTYVSPHVEYSPRFFATALADLEALTNRNGISHTFMTITMNETGAHRAQEYRNVDTLLANWCGKSWKHTPVGLQINI